MMQPIDPRVLRPPGIGPAQPSRTSPAGNKAGSVFADALARAGKGEEVVFSAHATDRLARRGIRFNDADRQRLSEAVSAVQAKGGRNSLVLMGTTALIVNVPSRTVVTALGAGTANERIITNIDSAVIS
ncbi:MAG: TIGR02530 family flagellar biosynthesis protein [Candidatus Deferrimicrobiaceae bacterium]